MTLSQMLRKETNRPNWIEAICDADFRTVLGNLNYSNVSLMLLNTMEEAINYYEAYGHE
ncbi:hypothetical protein [Paenibacillus glycanilyticus]|uniref:hypothetical protein n=1 Tax=Paenibacillus glycanilyticus TaxID=126569 RepID=UPI0019105DB9|nr:hypothetical protein [Paenibacillus glycanilyticus]